MNLEIISSLLEKYEIKEITVKEYDAVDFYLLDEGSEDLEETVYIAAGAVDCRRFKKSMIIITNSGRKITDSKKKLLGRNYIILEQGSLVQVYNSLAHVKSHLDNLRLALKSARDNQEIIDISTKMLGVPFFYLDSSYRILAIAKDFLIPGDLEWKHMIEKGFLSPANARLMQESGDMNMLAGTTEPVYYNAYYYPFSSIVCNILKNDQYYGRINRLCVDNDHSPVVFEECRIIVEELSRLASHDDSLPYADILENMIRDLLNGMSVSEELVRDRLQRHNASLHRFCQVACIEIPESSDPQVYTYYLNLASRMFVGEQAVTILFDSKIVVIFHADNEVGFSPLIFKLKSFVSSQNLKGAVSMVFREYSQIRGYYNQAVSALDRCADCECILLNDIYVDNILSFIPSEQRLHLISNDIKELSYEQKNYSFPLIDTLEMYLNCNCSLQQTADSMFIHKNTMTYRLNIIKEIIDADLTDENDRLILMLSIRLMKKQNGM